ncbi:MAG: WD40 repeat domain-containing protein [Gemmataceae bacterium]|nr:WD40 repeat domain-containing protein [Gemmataceae bacterium]
MARWSTTDAMGPVYALGFAKDGNTVASASRDGVVRIWQYRTGKVVRILKGHDGAVKTVAFSPDGKLVASAGADKFIRLWDVRIDAPLDRDPVLLKGHRDSIEALVFVRDNLLISAGQDQAIILWDLDTYQISRRLERHTRGVRALAVTRDGKTLASAGEDRTVCLWDLPAGKERRSFKRPGWIFSMTFSSDGSTLVSGGRDQLIHVRNMSTDEFTIFGGYEGPVESVALSRDGRMIAAGNDDGKVRLWEVVTQSVRRELDGHTGKVHSVALSPDESKLLSGGEDGNIFVWQLRSAKKPAARKPEIRANEWQAAWHELGGPADKAYEEMGQLREDPGQLLFFLEARLEPFYKLRQRLDALLRDLKSEQFSVRQKATQELEKLGEFTAPFLSERLQDNPSLETQRRIEQLLARAQSNEPERHSAYLQIWRTMELLEAIATTEARAMLERMSKEIPDARLRQEAMASLVRLKLSK